MPELFLPLAVSKLSNIPSPGRGLHALSKLQFTLGGPPDMRDYANVVHTAVLVLREFLTSEDIQDISLWQELTDLETLEHELQSRPGRSHPIGTHGYATKHPAWAYLATTTSSVSTDVQIALGAELIVAHILKRQFRMSVIRDLKKAVTELDTTHEHKKIATRLKRQASFHSYLCVAFDAEPIGWLRKSLEKSQRPRANCIWPHEIALLPVAIDRSTDDLRLRDQLKTWAQLLTCAQIRFGELKWIRHKDIIPFADHFQIHLANQPYVGSGKSPAADRLVFIRNPDAIQALRGWLERPEFRSAEPGSFIFASPDDPRKIYKLGKGYTLLTRCLKEVTGCNDFSVHLCRHTCISLAIERAIFGMVEFHEINPIHEVQVQSGHHSAETTWRTYFHLLEDAMTYWRDRAFRHLSISNRAAAWWSGRSAVNLRQDKHRWKE